MTRPGHVATLMLALALAGCSSGRDQVAKSEASITTTTADAPLVAEPAVEVAPDSTAMVMTTEIDAGLQAAIAELIDITQNLRQLSFEEPPVITVVTPQEMAARVRKLIEDELDPEETARDQALLASLGVLDTDADLGEMYLALYAEQVQGYYDGDTGELVVPSSGGELDVLEKMVLVHELTHALTDQAFGFQTRLDQLVEEEDYEGSAALRALAEGDATYTQALYFWQLPDEAQAEGLALIESGTGDALARTPSYIVDLLQFPYNEGARFATSLGTSGGFSALNDAYLDPPTTTEQIYDPERYEQREPPVAVDIEILKLDGYDLDESGVWGRAGLEALFEPSLGRGARLAAEGWGGDRYQVYWNGTQTVLVMSLIGDTAYETNEIFEGWTDFVAAQVPASTTAAVGWDGDQVVVVVSPDEALVSRVVAALGAHPTK